MTRQIAKAHANPYMSKITDPQALFHERTCRPAKDEAHRDE